MQVKKEIASGAGTPKGDKQNYYDQILSDFEGKVNTDAAEEYLQSLIKSGRTSCNGSVLQGLAAIASIAEMLVVETPDVLVRLTMCDLVTKAVQKGIAEGMKK